jgi:hypothetical protein
MAIALAPRVLGWTPSRRRFAHRGGRKPPILPAFRRVADGTWRRPGRPARAAAPPAGAAACPTSPRSGVQSFARSRLQSTYHRADRQRRRAVFGRSIVNELNRREIAVHLLAHPVLAVRRDLDGDLLGFAAEAGERARPESMMHIEIDRQGDPALLDELAAALTRVLAEVRLAVEDWRPMRRACLDAIADLAPSRSPNLGEYDDFLRWLEANHFTFLGHRRYRYIGDASQPAACAMRSCRPRSASCSATARLFEGGLGNGEAMARFARSPHNILIVRPTAPLVHRADRWIA